MKVLDKYLERYRYIKRTSGRKNIVLAGNVQREFENKLSAAFKLFV